MALLALLVVGAVFVFGQSNTAQADLLDGTTPPLPKVDGFFRDPVTGVVEAPYLLNGITYTVDSGPTVHLLRQLVHCGNHWHCQ